MRIKPYEVPGEIARHAFLIIMSVIFLIPFYVAIINVFKTRLDIVRAPLSIPWARLTLDNIVRNLFAPHFNILIGYGTSLVISGLTVGAVVVLGSMMSYVLCRKKQRFFTYAYLLLLAGLMIPAQVILLPIVQVLRHLHLMFTIWGLLLMNIGWYLPFASFLFVGYMRTVSPQFDESARMDGAGDVRIFFRIIFPLITPCVASIIIFVSLWTWNDFVNPLIILGSSDFYTITIGVYRAIGQFVQKWEDVFAVVFIAIVPVIVFYLFMQKQFVSGLTAGALKG
ncbi:MAG: carbohydrate ABC transporter permease [Spirochaetia bacterium]|jgi:raffinose/stachyose/melibiose transport system permease protein